VGAVEVLQALSDPARLQLLARIADAGEAGCALDAAAGDPRAARKRVARLSAAGLVESRGGAFVARLDRIRDAVDEIAGGRG
jgi:DNA-binding transcriptional ArsR family regulator